MRHFARALIFARHYPQIAVAVVHVAALAQLAGDGLRIVVAPAFAAMQRQLRGLLLAELWLAILGIFVGHPHQAFALLAAGDGPLLARGAAGKDRNDGEQTEETG